MTSRILFVSLVFVGGLALLPASAPAQGAYPGRYQSRSGPTITPYLDYFRQDNTVLGPYHTFVRPRAQLRETQRQLDSRLQLEANRNSNLQREFQQLRESAARPTGSGATFMNYSHYYPPTNPQGAARK